MKPMLILLASLVLVGCDQSEEDPSTTDQGADDAAATEPATDPTATPAPATDAPAAGADAASPSQRLDQVLASQPDSVKSRYEYRHPKETLEFFGIEPRMTVVEALPGGGWYTRILLPYLGPDGRLIGANYAQDMWPKFGIFDQEFVDSMQTWVQDWPEQAGEWRGPNGAEITAFEFGSLPAELEGQADAVLLIRALHNLARFDDEGGYLGTALNDVVRVLKPGGIVGVVQHEARPETPDAWASGDAGYLKRQFVIDRLTEAGLELVEQSDVNQNPNDQPTTEDVVWRLPPSYATSAEDPERRAEVDAIGESNRMTLKFRKPEG